MMAPHGIASIHTDHLAKRPRETKETKRYPGAKPVPAVDRATADWQARDLTNAPKLLLR